MRLEPAIGARIVVVGSSGGIGRAVVDALLASDCKVAALDLPQSLDRAPPPPRVTTVLAFDGTDEASVMNAFTKLAETWGAIDGLVITSGFAGARKELAHFDFAEIDEIFRGNLMLAALVLKHAAPMLTLGTNSAVVLMSSDMAYAPQPGYAPYVAAKAGIVALGRSVARELAPKVRINIVSPGAVDTPFLRGGMGRADDLTAPLRFDLQAYLSQVPLGRMATSSDVVGPILFLLGGASVYMTGQVLHVSGGAVTV